MFYVYWDVALVGKNTQEYMKLNPNTTEVNYSNNKYSYSIQCEVEYHL